MTRSAAPPLARGPQPQPWCTGLVLPPPLVQFQDRISTFIAEEVKVMDVAGQEVTLKIWDTAGATPTLHYYERCTAF